MRGFRLWAAAAAGPAVAAGFYALAALRRCCTSQELARGAFSTALPYDFGSEQVVLLLVRCPPMTGGPLAMKATVLPARWLNCVPLPPTGSGSSCEPPSPSGTRSRWPP
jgi:hypothetical protein